MHVPDYSHYAFEDFVMDADFRAWVLAPDAESRHFWEQYLVTHPEQRSLIQEAIQVVQHLNPNEDLPVPESRERIWQVLEHRFDARQASAEQSEKAVRVRQLLPWRWAAAVTVLLVCAGLLWYLAYPRTRQLHTAFGQVERVVLPDGSEVTLNGNSTLSYREDWQTQALREVWLDGEAFFKVTRQASASGGRIKFITHTPQLDIAVLGTVFNVSTRRGKTDVVLLEGKVALSNRRSPSAGTLEMKPGQLATLSEGVARAEVRPAPPGQHTAWMKDFFVFDNTPLAQVAARLEDTYGLEVTFEDREMTDYRLTANLSSQDLDALLDVIAATFHLELQREKERVFFRRPQP
ncbi:MAG: FecR domain-containing protein [Cytophagales bacterium]|nr:FecR domain-containing protein [Cytophagales bacterium]